LVCVPAAVVHPQFVLVVPKHRAVEIQHCSSTATRRRDCISCCRHLPSRRHCSTFFPAAIAATTSTSTAPATATTTGGGGGGVAATVAAIVAVTGVASAFAAVEVGTQLA
jgi:hypothetical protein